MWLPLDFPGPHPLSGPGFQRAVCLWPGESHAPRGRQGEKLKNLSHFFQEEHTPEGADGTSCDVSPRSHFVNFPSLFTTSSRGFQCQSSSGRCRQKLNIERHLLMVKCVGPALGEGASAPAKFSNLTSSPVPLHAIMQTTMLVSFPRRKPPRGEGMALPWLVASAITFYPPSPSERAGHRGVADVTLQMRTLSPKEAEGLAQHHHGAELRQKLRVSH